MSSFDTRSTQSNSSPIGSPSRISPALSRITGASAARLPGETTGLTVLRWWSCLGGSMAMNIGRDSSPPLPPMTMPPSEASDEKRLWSVSTAMMSL